MRTLRQPLKTSHGEELRPPARSHVSERGSLLHIQSSLQRTAALADIFTVASREIPSQGLVTPKFLNYKNHEIIVSLQSVKIEDNF